MPMTCRSLVVSIAAALLTAAASAAGVPPLAVQERALVLPSPRPGEDRPLNLPADGDVKLPFVTGGAPGVAAQINATVWSEMLDGAAAPKAPGKTFTPPADQLPQGTMSLAYEAHFMPPRSRRLLQLRFSGEGCGAYCESFDRALIFDLRDGRKLALADLLTADGLATVGRRADAERRRLYRQQIRDWQLAIRQNTAPKPDDVSDAEDRLFLNQECLKDVKRMPSTAERLKGDVHFTLDGRGGLVLWLGRCSNHAMRALDDVGEIKVAVRAAQLKASLTPYGRAVLQR